MTAAILLAWLVIASVLYNIVENVIDPSAVRMTVNNQLAGFIRLIFGLATIFVALVVVFAG